MATVSKKARSKPAAKAKAAKPAAKPAAKKAKAAAQPVKKAPPAPKAAAIAEPERSSAPMAEVDGEVLEFIAAIDTFKKQHGRPFPSWSEVLLIVRQLGYRRS
ncbi:MAG: hypothetical protein H6835_13155 [Planctomycetes bacterium]|nr:hypothetical protein [Planctomycetota bacterium]